MPNHFHAILYFAQIGYDLNNIIGNDKRIIAYKIIQRLKEQKKDNLLLLLAEAVTESGAVNRGLYIDLTVLFSLDLLSSVLSFSF